MTSRATLQEFAARAIRVPFRAGGRDRSGWDCWGLVSCAYREVYDRDLPSWAAEYDSTTSYEELARLIASERDAAGWRRLPGPVPGAVGLYRVGRFASHVGLVLPQRRDRCLLHVEVGIGTVLEPLETRAWARRIEGFYAHPEVDYDR